jgi:primase-polymerase (primpol)-like protein
MTLPDKKSFPKALRKLDQWLQYKIVDGVKIPKQCHPNGNASSTDPDTWSCFYDAYTYFNEDKRDGLGFALTVEDGYIVFDMDKVRNPETGDTVEWAATMIEDLDSLTYISQSGTGYHIWMRCTEPLPGKGLSSNWPTDPDTALEIFEQKRFIVMSGNLFKKTGIKDRTERIHNIYKKIAAHKAKKHQQSQPKPSGAKAFRSHVGKGITLKDFLDKHNVAYRTKNDVFQLHECPWSSSHTDESDGVGHAAVFTLSDGRWAFSCCHNHCEDRGIKHFTAFVKGE